MKRKRYTEPRIVFALRQAAAAPRRPALPTPQWRRWPVCGTSNLGNAPVCSTCAGELAGGAGPERPAGPA